VLQRSFQGDACLEAMARYGTTITFAVPTQLDQLTGAATWGRRLPRLRTIISGGAPCPPHTLAAVRAAGYPVRDAYGLTECGPNCFRATPEQESAPEGSVGWPLPYLETRIVNHAGALVPPGETGELQMRGPQLFAGYFRDPERTARALTADGWLRTGDVAAVDEHGAHVIRGRLSDMFISGGENVHPGEVEVVLRRCAHVRDAVVVGVPDATWGEVGHAVVVAESGAIDRDALRREARTWLAGYKLPRHVTVVQDLPRLGSGKVDRQAVRALVTPSAGAPRAP
jgi:fatty-acyl-CoA synthase